MRGWVFTVLGTPAPQGSKKGFVNKKNGKVILVESSAAVKPWRQAVVSAAPSGPKLDGPIAVYCVFTMPRPASAKKSLLRPATRPDCGKLLRSTEDAITDAGLWADDARVCEFSRLAKVWPGYDPFALPTPGVLIAAVEIEAGWERELYLLASLELGRVQALASPRDGDGWG